MLSRISQICKIITTTSLARGTWTRGWFYYLWILYVTSIRLYSGNNESWRWYWGSYSNMAPESYKREIRLSGSALQVVSNFSANRFHIWNDFSYVLYNFADEKKQEDIENIGQTFAICLLNPADFVPNYRSAPQSLLLGIDPARCSLRSCMFHHLRFALGDVICTPSFTAHIAEASTIRHTRK